MRGKGLATTDRYPADDDKRSSRYEFIAAEAPVAMVLSTVDKNDAGKNKRSEVGHGCHT